MKGQLIQKYSTFDAETFERLKEMEAGDIFTALTPSMTKQNKTGLLPSQSYSILDCKEIDGLKLIKLRNVFGTKKGEWTGDYSNISTKWTKRLRKKVGFDNRDDDDGIFWMTVEDFSANFNAYTWNTEYQAYSLGKAAQNVKDLFSVEKRVLEKGDKVLSQKPSLRSKTNKPWFMGTVVSTNKKNKTAKIQYEDLLSNGTEEEEEDGVQSIEILYAPHGPFNKTIGTNIRYNEVEKVVNYGFWKGAMRLPGKVQPVEFVKQKQTPKNNNNNNNNSPWGGGNSDDKRAREERRQKELSIQRVTDEKNDAVTRLRSILATPGAATDGRGWIVLGAVFNERSAHLHFLTKTSGPPPQGWQKKFITQVQQQLETVLIGDQNQLLKTMGKALFDPLLGWDVVSKAPIPGRDPPTYLVIDRFLFRAKAYCGEKECRRQKQRLESVEPTKKELSNISEACDRLWDLDTELRLKPGKDYKINLQRTTGGNRDAAPDELFTWINDKKLLSTPVYSKFVPLLDNYEFEPGKAEHHDGNIEKKEMSEFLDACLDTACIRYVYKWLVMNKRFNGNYRISFKKKLHDLWFNNYSRASRGRRGQEDSSAFEHIFVGEHKRDRDTGRISVIGMHNWLAFLTFERQGTWNYYGFKTPRGRRGRNPASSFEQEQVLTLVFEWEGQVKPVSTTFMGTSPSFELALYTLSFLCDGGQQKLVPCKMGPYRLGIQVYTYRGGNIGSCHPTDAPANFDEAAAFIQSKVRGRQERQRLRSGLR